MFRVLDGGKPADCQHHKVDKSWAVSLFDTFEAAEEYALNWLGIYGPGKGVLKLNTPHDYSGYGDCVEIREVD